MPLAPHPQGYEIPELVVAPELALVEVQELALALVEVQELALVVALGQQLPEQHSSPHRRQHQPRHPLKQHRHYAQRSWPQHS